MFLKLYKVKYYILMAIFFNSLGYADTDGTCRDCSKSSTDKINSFYFQVKKIIGNRQVYNKRCYKFINPIGELGPYGIKLVKAIDKITNGCFYNNFNVGSICRNYTKFNKRKKQQFWAFTFSSIAQVEASCNPKARNKAGTNDIADGLFQLEYSSRQRKQAGRKKWCRPGQAINSQNIDFQIECAVSIMYRKSCKPGDALVETGSYWQKLRRKDRAISKLVAKFPGCK